MGFKVKRPMIEETKGPEPPQTVELTGEAVMSATSIGPPPIVNQQPIETPQQSADTIQATLLTF